MPHEVDARGLSCPQPVRLTLQTIQSSDGSDVMQAETLLKQAGMAVRAMGPPPNLRTGCDLVKDFPLICGKAALNDREFVVNGCVSPVVREPRRLSQRHVSPV